jgi:hypothetical protein
MSASERVILSVEGVSFVRQDGWKYSFRWEEVAGVFFYRVDVAADKVLTVVTFDLHDGRYWEVIDYMDGFAEFVSGLANYLPLSHPDWQTALQNATIDDRPVTIFGRPNGPDSGTSVT